MKKFLFVSNVPSPYNVEYLNELGKKMDVTAVFERGSSAERDSSWQNLNVKNFKCNILDGFRFNVDSALSLGICKYLRQFKKDHIVIGNPTTPTGIVAILYCKLHKIPYIIQSEGGIAKDGKGLMEKLKWFLMHSAKLYLSGMSLKNEYFLTYGGTPERIFQYPFTSLYEDDIVKKPLSGSDKIELRKALGIDAECMFVYVGQFIYRKGIDVLLRACAFIDRNVYVLLIGGEPTEEYLSIINELQLKNIHFINFIDKEKLKKYYAASDFFVLPTREDTWGLVVNEAMAAGLPVITTFSCVAGVELIEDGINGFLVDKDNPEQLANRMNLLIRDNDRCNEMGTKCLVKIQNYTYESMADRIKSILETNEG